MHRGQRDGAYRLGARFVTGILLGIGVVGFVDETVFHQLLQWHSFYWATDQHGRVLSDGLFHAFSTLVLLWGALRLWRTPRPSTPDAGDAITAAALIGGGGFNTYDGVVQHLLLHFHLVNEYVCPVPEANNAVSSCPADVPFEVAWIAVGMALLLTGIVWWNRAAARVAESREA
jgi:uncharacterized membrane protein